ncbi:hypothetical protein U5640_16910 [Streptomyces sp. SS7]|uniref:hypothetical protein n=1 Tax=Streptomyces sp. SS7 TaxID=3108485 RepID=UPI0030ED03E4
MSRKFTKRMKRQRAEQVDLLERLIKAHGQWEKDREEFFRENLKTYDPYPNDQPCADWEMGDYDEMDTDYAFDAQHTWVLFVEEARMLLEMEK